MNRRYCAQLTYIVGTEHAYSKVGVSHRLDQDSCTFLSYGVVIMKDMVSNLEFYSNVTVLQ